jgi:hypothetical protein
MQDLGRKRMAPALSGRSRSIGHEKGPPVWRAEGLGIFCCFDLPKVGVVVSVRAGDLNHHLATDKEARKSPGARVWGERRGVGPRRASIGEE